MLTFGLLYHSGMSNITISSDPWAQILPLLQDGPDVYVGDPKDGKRFVEGVL